MHLGSQLYRESYEIRHPCPRCKRTYRHRTNMINHLRDACGVDPKYECDICKKKFYQKSNLKTHMKSRHKMMFPAKPPTVAVNPIFPFRN